MLVSLGFQSRIATSFLVTFAQRRSCRAFAARTGAQLLWIQAEDRPPYAYFGDKSKSELQQIKRRWLAPSFHARKTEGIMSLLPFADGMPLRVTDNNGVDFKKYKICKGTQCRARALTLHETDIARV